MSIDLKRLPVALVAALIGLAGAVAAEEKRTEVREPTNDREFVIKAIAGEIAEIKLAELAKKQTQIADIAKFADAIIADHTKMRDALLERAKAMKLAVVEGTEKEHRDVAAKLAKLTGDDFDREYSACMVESHEKAIKAYESWAKKAGDAEVAKFVNDSLPTLKEHKKNAEQLAAKFKKK